MKVVLAIGSKCEVTNSDDVVYTLDIRPGVGILQGDIINLHKFDQLFDGGNWFDRIECHHVLEHLHPNDVLTALLELKRMLKIFGKLEVSVPDMEACARTLLQGNREILNNIFGTFEDPDATTHKWGYCSDTLYNILDAAEFSKIYQVEPKDIHEMRFECIK
jgi:predicted SAM-dependent methyltransferase